MAGKPIQILKLSENHNFELDLTALRTILLQDSVKDKPAVVVSVAGTFRTGKSFLLNFFLRYLKAKGNVDWLESEKELSQGFFWAPGHTRVTTGIHMWSHPFIVDMEDGTQVALLLMDTQGTFDGKSIMKESGIIFALSTILSSVLIYNIMKDIHDYDLEHLQLFADYGKQVMDVNQKPFQKLQFLVRDYAYEDEYGLEGGTQLLEDRFQISDSGLEELCAVRDLVKSCFDDINCFLLPYPGKKVAGSRGFLGNLSDIDPDFIQHLATFVPLILEPKNLITKNINGKQLTVGELYECFTVCFNKFMSEDIPPPQTALMATITADNLKASSEAVEFYMKHMSSLVELLSNDSSANFESFQEEHDKIKKEALNLFSNQKKRGGKEGSEKFYKNLEQDLEKQYMVLRNRLECHKRLQSISAKEEKHYVESIITLFHSDHSNDLQNWEQNHLEFLQKATKPFDNLNGFDEADDLIHNYRNLLEKKLGEMFGKMKTKIEERQKLQDLVEELKQTYNNKMEHRCGVQVLHIQEQMLCSHHLSAKEDILQSFSHRSMTFESSLVAQYRDRLNKEIQSIYITYEDQNKHKSMYEKLVMGIVEEFKRALERECPVSEQYALYKLKKNGPLCKTDLLKTYENKLRSELYSISKEHSDRLTCDKAKEVAKAGYNLVMDVFCGINTYKVQPSDIEVKHEEIKQMALNQYNVKTMYLTRNICEEYKRKLENEFFSRLGYYKAINEAKSSCTIL